MKIDHKVCSCGWIPWVQYAVQYFILLEDIWFGASSEMRNDISVKYTN